MPRREIISVAVYDRNEIERDRRKMVSRAKTCPKFVHGKMGHAMLLHKVSHVDLHWYDLAWDKAIRLAHPKMIAHTVCGASFFLEAGRSGVCEMPKPDAVLCGMCTGEGRIFGRNGNNKVTKRQAKDRLGCIAEGAEI